MALFLGSLLHSIYVCFSFVHVSYYFDYYTLWNQGEWIPIQPSFFSKLLSIQCCLSFYTNFIVCFASLGPHLQHMEVPRLGVESELQLLAYDTATSTQDQSHVCDLHHSSGQHQTHWARPGIEPASSWILVGLISTEQQQELPPLHIASMP